jgi:hypothetical protein
MMQQATYLQVYMLAQHQNFIAAEIDAGTGYITRSPRIIMAPPPFMGENLTLNNINISNSTVASINTGTIQNLDAQITLSRSEGNTGLSEALQDFAQALVDTQEIVDTVKNEVAEQLEFLVAQVATEPNKRRGGLIKGALAGIIQAVGAVPTLLTLWDKLRPQIESTLGV